MGARHGVCAAERLQPMGVKNPVIKAAVSEGFLRIIKLFDRFHSVLWLFLKKFFGGIFAAQTPCVAHTYAKGTCRGEAMPRPESFMPTRSSCGSARTDRAPVGIACGGAAHYHRLRKRMVLRAATRRRGPVSGHPAQAALRFAPVGMSPPSRDRLSRVGARHASPAVIHENTLSNTNIQSIYQCVN